MHTTQLHITNKQSNPLTAVSKASAFISNAAISQHEINLKRTEYKYVAQTTVPSSCNFINQKFVIIIHEQHIS